MRRPQPWVRAPNRIEPAERVADVTAPADATAMANGTDIRHPLRGFDRIL
jgi:hypothetical protein